MQQQASDSQGTPVLQRLRAALGRAGLLHARTRLVVLPLVLLLALFQLQRLLVLLFMPERFDGVGATTVAQAFLVGLRFDAVVAAMLVLPLAIVAPLAPPKVLESRRFRAGVFAFLALVVAAAAVLLVCDYFFFQEFGERLNHKVVNYVGVSGNAYLWDAVWRDYPVLRAAVGVLLVGSAGAWLVSRFAYRDEYNVGPLWQAVVWPALTIAALAVVIRGTLGSHALNTGPAYFSPSSSLAQLALNGGFTLRQAVVAAASKDVDLGEMYPTVPEDEAFRRVVELVRRPGDQFLDDPDNPLLRLTDTGRPRRDYNVVLVVLESLHWAYVGATGGDARLSPNLDRIAREGVLLDRCFAVGTRTQRGFSGIVSGFPDLPVASVTTREEVAGRFLTLPGLLDERGYHNLFIYGGPALRDHRQTYLGSNGVDEFVCADDLPVRTFRTKLGWCDGDLFDSAVQVLSRQPKDRPFSATLLTVTFHRPYEIPPNAVEPVDPASEVAPQLDAIKYTDAAIGRFIEQAKQTDWFDDTLFVFAADHMGGFRQYTERTAAFRVPVVFYGPKIDGLGPPRVISGVRSQTDVAPSILRLLGGTWRHCFFGTDALDRPAGAADFAFAHADSEELLFFDGDSVLTTVYPNGGGVHQSRLELPETFVPVIPETPEQLDLRDEAARNAVSIVQAADALFRRQTYNAHGPPVPPAPPAPSMAGTAAPLAMPQVPAEPPAQRPAR